jgi:hypothetical protein
MIFLETSIFIFVAVLFVLTLSLFIKKAHPAADSKYYLRIELLVVLLALINGINSQSSSFLSKYVINDDVHQHIYWMQQFRDSGLFRNDLLTAYARNYQPSGFILLYRMLSFLISPTIIGKILPVILLAISSLYVFRLVSRFTNNYTGFLAAFIFMVTPHYMQRMTGGHPRAFAYPLLIIFLYYLIKKRYSTASIVMVLQCLFYPVIFMLSVPVYLFTFIKLHGKKVVFNMNLSRIKYFVLALSIGVLILTAKYILVRNPSIGTTVTKKQMLNNPEFYEKGRHKILPISPLTKEMVRISRSGCFISGLLEKPFDHRILSLIIILFFIFEIARRKMFFPPELLFLLLSSMLMYKISDFLLFKLFLPARYLEYPVPLISLIIYTVVIGQLIEKIRNFKVKKIIQIIVIVSIFMNFGINKNIGLGDWSGNKELYERLQNLPKDAIIASHPYLADGIPTFAQRKVFIKYELSHPWFDKYWKTIKNRTNDFFNAYYSEDISSVYGFCEKYGIDYLVVDRQHFTEEYFREEKIYFEPFNAYIMNLIKERKNFALPGVFTKDSPRIIVIKGVKS